VRRRAKPEIRSPPPSWNSNLSAMLEKLPGEDGKIRKLRRFYLRGKKSAMLDR